MAKFCNPEKEDRKWRRCPQEPPCLQSWSAVQWVAAQPGEDSTVPSMAPCWLLSTLAGPQRELHQRSLWASDPWGVPPHPTPSVQHGGVPYLYYSSHTLWEGRSVSFTSYPFHVNAGNQVPQLVNVGDKFSFFFPLCNRVLDDCRHRHTSLKWVPCRLCSAFFSQHRSTACQCWW